MRGDQRLERGKPDARRRWTDGSWTAAALAVVLAFAAARAGAADRPDLRSPEAAPVLPESEPPLELPPPIGMPSSELTLLWFDPKALLPMAFELVSKEVTGIFRGVGVRVRWVRGGTGTVFGDGGGVEIPVILLPADPLAPRASRRVMGLVPKKLEGPRVVWTFLDSVRWTLGHKPETAISARQRDELGLALARVVAHEVVHAVAPDEPHTTGGLMHHSMDRAFLLGANARVDPGCARVFRRRLEELTAPAAPASAHAGKERSAPGP